MSTSVPALTRPLTLLARVVLGASAEQTIGHLSKEMEKIARELKSFHPLDFRAREVQERVVGTETDEEPDTE